MSAGKLTLKYTGLIETKPDFKAAIDVQSVSRISEPLFSNQHALTNIIQDITNWWHK